MDREEEYGTYKSDRETNFEIKKYLGYQSKNEISNKTSLDILKEEAWIALIRFSEIQRGERIGVREIKERFSKLRQIGCKVKPYSKMKREEAWNYLQEIKNNIKIKLKIYSPETLREIDKENRERLENLVV